MPSHKHKKSKKKNKHQTKQNSTFLHKILTWNERFSNSDSESSENEDRLTNLVSFGNTVVLFTKLYC